MSALRFEDPDLSISEMMDRWPKTVTVFLRHRMLCVGCLVNRFRTVPESLEAMRTLTPTHSVFNGSVGALTGTNALRSDVGKTVLMIHNQANRDTRPHLIGGHGNFVWESGSFSDAPQTGLETWFIRGGSAGAAMHTFEQPGVYAYVNHNLIEAAILGATAHFVVDGDWNNALMEQIVPPRQITT